MTTTAAIRADWRKFYARLANSVISILLAVIVFETTMNKVLSGLESGRDASTSAPLVAGAAILGLSVAIPRAFASAAPSGRKRIALDLIAMLIAALFGSIALFVTHIPPLAYILAIATFAGPLVQDFFEDEPTAK